MACVLLAALATQTAADTADTEECIECHSDPEFSDAETPLMTSEGYAASVHFELDCVDCHLGENDEAFDTVPHVLAEGGPVACLFCHKGDFDAIEEGYRGSVHATRLGEKFSCVRCHDPHAMPRERGVPRSPERTEQDNAACLHCHRDADLGIAARQPGKQAPATAHGWLPRPDKHARMRCVVCHTPIDGRGDPGDRDQHHAILPAEQAIRDCEACHGEDAPLVLKYVGERERRGWITNPLVFEEAYLPGTVRNRLADAIVLALFALTLLGAVVHGVLRLRARAKYPEPPYSVESIFLYPVGVRVWHWTNATLMILLAITGMRLHFGGKRAPVISFELAFHIHNLAGALLVVLGLLYFFRNWRSGDARQYLGKPQEGFRGFVKQARFYVYGIFRGEEHPYHAEPKRRFNPLQQGAYAGVMYLLFPVLIVTGVLLLYPSTVPDRLWGKPGVWWFATAHYLSAAGIVAFVISHLYLITMGDRIGYLLTAMFTGWHKHHVRQSRDDDPTTP